MLSSFLLAIFLTALGAGLYAWHLRAWKRAAAQTRESDPRELAFAGRQFRRRRRVSILLAALGVAIAGGELLRDPLLSLVYWSGTMLLVFWIVALAVLDLAASQQHFGAQRSERDAAEALLMRQFKREFGHQQNGHPPANEIRKEE
jgi:hypothetical protein